MIKAIIFDMDGLLIDSEPLWAIAETEVISKAGVPITKERTAETMALRIDDVVEYWFSKYPWTGPSKEEMAREIMDRVVQLINQEGVMMPGAKRTIEFFAEKNLPLAIASSSAKRIIEAFLDKMALRKYIKIIHSAEKEPYGKPHPGVYIAAAEKMGIRPEYCLAFEDSFNGVLSAKSARMKCVAVPSEPVKKDPRFCIADVRVDSLLDFNSSAEKIMEKLS